MDPTDYIQFVLALVFVLGLIGVMGLIMRRYGPGGTSLPRSKGGGRRLAVVESLPLDPRRRLLLVRRDGKEHLLLLGPQTDQLVEADIDPPEEVLTAEEDMATDGVVQRLDTVIRRIGTRRGQNAPATETQKAEGTE